MSCSDLRNKFILNKSSCNNLCDDSNGSPTKCAFDCDMECAHAGSSGGGSSASEFQMVYDNCYSQHCSSSIGCKDLSLVLDCCNNNCNKNPVCMDVCASNNANKGRPPAPVDNNKGYTYFQKCAASIHDDDQDLDKILQCCDNACGNDTGCAYDCSEYAKNNDPYKPYKPYNPPTPVNPTPINPTPVNPTPVNPTPVNPTPVNPTNLVTKPGDIFSKITTPMWWGIGLGIALLVILITLIIISRRKAAVSKFGFRFY